MYTRECKEIFFWRRGDLKKIILAVYFFSQSVNLARSLAMELLVLLILVVIALIIYRGVYKFYVHLEMSSNIIKIEQLPSSTVNATAAAAATSSSSVLSSCSPTPPNLHRSPTRWDLSTSEVLGPSSADEEESLNNDKEK